MFSTDHRPGPGARSVALPRGRWSGVERACDGCGKRYEARRVTSKYCGGTCRTRASRAAGRPAVAPAPVVQVVSPPRRARKPSLERKPALRSVGTDERSPRPAAPATVAEAARSGDPKALLVAMRERIAETVSNMACPPRDLASLTRRLQDISKEIAAINHAEKAEAERGGPAEDEAFDASAL